MLRGIKNPAAMGEHTNKSRYDIICVENLFVVKAKKQLRDMVTTGQEKKHNNNVVYG